MSRNGVTAGPVGAALGQQVSRRALLQGIAVAALVPAVILRSERPAGAQSAGPPPGTASPLLPRRDHAAVAMGDGSVLVAGGFYNGPLSDVQIYRDGQWVRAASLLTPRYQHAAVALGDGSVLVLGGYNVGPMADVERYDPVADVWSRVSPMRYPRHQHSAALAGDSVLVMGGVCGGVLDDAEIYTP